MHRIFLDTQQWNYLVEPKDGGDFDLPRLRNRLITEVRANRLVIVGSWPLLQEVAGTSRRHPTKYSAMRELLVDAVRAHWLVPINERHVQEATYRGILPEPTRYLNRTRRRELVKISAHPAKVALVANAAFDQTQAFKHDQENIRAGMGRKLAEATGSEDVQKIVESWWETVDLDDWIIEIVDEGVRRRILDTPADSRNLRWTYPSAWLFTAFKLARIRLNLGEHRKIQPSDLMDAEHCALGDYVDLFVTDDRALRATLTMLPGAVFNEKLVAFEEFVGLLA